MTYNVYTLGCKVNEYESQVMDNLMAKAGYKKDNNPDICIINTCSVTNNTDSKSRKLINKLKRENPSALIVVTGCHAQNKKDIDADIVLGNKDKSKIVDYIKNYKDKITKIYDIKDMDFENMTLSNSDLTRAYIKIQDGCDNYCSYCIIPYLRGHVRCKKWQDVIKEASFLVSNGHQEIVLTGIHTGNYKDGDVNFSSLLEKLLKIEKLSRLRISSIEITELDDKFLELLKTNEVLVNHMHIPLQSGSDEVLKKMNRKYNTDYFIQKINEIRNIRPNMNITTDIIVGFPEESDQNFVETINTVKKINFSKIHVFPYSKRDNTKAADMIQVDEKVKKQRVNILLDLSKKLEIKYMNDNLNKEYYFIPEVYKDDFLIGHTENYLYIKVISNKSLLNKNVKIKTLSVEYPYIIGKIIDKQ